ncbi:UL36 [anatid alphaherpesvirus 1]|nr:UL36 [Anatid alphaherpesvirus 1]UJO49893.1 UL36 [Anatid alphaherpesvirus 1]WKE35605.1 large tegument protein [Anatid alphaherpesvirus 1]
MAEQTSTNEHSSHFCLLGIGTEQVMAILGAERSSGTCTKDMEYDLLAAVSEEYRGNNWSSQFHVWNTLSAVSLVHSIPADIRFDGSVGSEKPSASPPSLTADQDSTSGSGGSRDDPVGFIIATGTTNQSSYDLAPWGEKAGALHTLAFMRASFLSGVCDYSSDVINAILRQGASFAEQLNKQPKTFVHPNELPYIVRGADGDALFCFVSGTFIITTTKTPPNLEERLPYVPETRLIEGIPSILTIWSRCHQKADGLYVTVGNTVLGMWRDPSKEWVTVFTYSGLKTTTDPASIFRVRLKHLEGMLMCYTIGMHMLAVNFAYFLRSGDSSLSVYEGATAAANFYGTTDFTLCRNFSGSQEQITVLVQAEAVSVAVASVRSGPTARDLLNVISAADTVAQTNRDQPIVIVSKSVSAHATVTAVGYRNQYAAELCPGSSVSCLRSSLAFLRALYIFGIESSHSADLVDVFLRQGREWTIDTTARGEQPSMCSLNELPGRIESSAPGIVDLCVVTSRIYGDYPFYGGPGIERVMETTISARVFIDTVMTQRKETYCLLIIGAQGFGLYRKDDEVFIFDPHGHADISQAFTARLSIGNLYPFLTTYADISANPYWSGVLVYFIVTGPGTPTTDELTCAVSRLYGTGDTQFLESSKYSTQKVVARLDGLIGLNAKTTHTIGVGGYAHAPCVTFETSQGWPIDIGNNVYECGDAGKLKNNAKEDNAKSEHDHESMLSDSVAVNDLSWEEQRCPWKTAFEETENCSQSTEDRVNELNEISTLSPVEEAISTSDMIYNATGQITSPDFEPVPPPSARIRSKRRRPVWTPPSSTENLTGGLAQDRHSRVKYTKRGRHKRRSQDTSSSASLSGSCTELSDMIADIAYAPGPIAMSCESQNNSIHCHQSGNIAPDNITDESRQDENYSVEMWWNDEYLNAIDVTDMTEKIMEIDTIIESDMSSPVRVVRPLGSNNEDDLLEQYILTIYSRMYAFIIENGARTVPERQSLIAPLIPVISASFPRKTAFGAFIESTGMILLNVPIHAELISSVRTEGAHLGGLALIKMVLMAIDSAVASDELHTRLDVLRENAQKTGTGGYELVASALSEEFTKNTIGIYAEKTYTHPSVSLSDRLKAICESIRVNELEAKKTGLELAKILAAIGTGVRRMHDYYDTFYIDEDPLSAPMISETLSPIRADDVPAKISEIYEEAVGVLGNAIREYCLNGASYSAKALSADRNGRTRFKIASVAIDPITRMVNSLPAFDSALTMLASRAGVDSPQSISSSREAGLLSDLLNAGQDISNDETLGNWLALMTEAQINGYIECKELAALIREINTINERAARHASIEAELQRFEALSAAVQEALNGAARGGPAAVSLDTLIRGAEELVARAHYIESPRISCDLTDEQRSAVRDRRIEVESMLHTYRGKMDKISGVLSSLYESLRMIFKPTNNFIGLRNINQNVKALTDSLPPELGSLSAVVANAPQDVSRAMRTDLWTHFSHYREALEKPTTFLATELSGLGPCFTLAIKITTEHIGGFPGASVFFGKHADGVAAAITAAVASPKSATATTAAINVLEVAIGEVDHVVTKMKDNTAKNAMSFLRPIVDKLKTHLIAIDELGHVEAASRALRSASETSAALASKIRASDPSIMDDTSFAAMAAEAKRVCNETKAVADSVERDLAKTPITIAASVFNVKEADILKYIQAARQRVAEVDSAMSDASKTHQTVNSERALAIWKDSVTAAIVRAETRSEFDQQELTRLSDIAAVDGYKTTWIKKRAEAVAANHLSLVTTALDTVLHFNPYSTENMRTKAPPPISLLRDITWGDAFMAAAPAFSELFEVDVELLISALRMTMTVLAHISASAGSVDFYDLIGHIERDLTRHAPLLKYIQFYRKGNTKFKEIVPILDAMRADVCQAMGQIPSELNRVLEDISRIRCVNTARNILENSVRLEIPSMAIIERIASELENLDTQPLKDTAYIEYVENARKHYLSEAKSAMDTAFNMYRDAETKAKTLLNNIIENDKALEKDKIEGLSNLKNLLRLTPLAPHYMKAIDKAETADDIVTQAALILAHVEKTEELDVQAVEWLQQAKAIIDSHPLTVLIDDSGPMAPYADRIDALVTLRSHLDELTNNIASSEAAWDAAWDNYIRDKNKVDVDADGYALAMNRANTLQAAGSVVLALRADSEYRRLPTKLTSALDTKYTERLANLDAFTARTRDIDDASRHLSSLLTKVPNTYDVRSLRHQMAQLAELLSKLPKWCAEDASPFKHLLQLRLTLYAAYADLCAGRAGVSDPILHQSPIRKQKKIDAGGGIDRLLKCRVAARLESRVIMTVREYTSDIDPIHITYMDTTDDPIHYSMCYRAACDKIAVNMFGDGTALLPPMPRISLSDGASIEAASILRELLDMRVQYYKAIGSDYSTFARFVRHKRPDWRPEEANRAVAETYSALIATTLCRHLGGVSWGEISFVEGATGPVACPCTLIQEPPDSIIGTKDAKRSAPVSLDLGDVMVTLIAWAPQHILTFVTLDLVLQHEYMSKTLPTAVATAFSSRLLINSLDLSSSNDEHTRVLPGCGNRYDPSNGSLFALRMIDWRRGRLSEDDPLKPWDENSSYANSQTMITDIANLRNSIPSRILTTMTVLGRMCIPPAALAAMWSVLRPEDIGSEISTYDMLLRARFDTSSMIGTSISIEGHCNNVDGSTTKRTNVSGKPKSLYEPTGTTVSFTVINAPPSNVSRVNAMDMAVTATLLGAKVVIAAEYPGAYSDGSGLTLCMRLFDSRDNSEGSFINTSSVSTDLSSWGIKLLDLDPNSIENSCLIAQLENLSGIIASKPLEQADPCLILVDGQMRPTQVLWPKEAVKIPIIRLVSEKADVLDELPYIDTEEETLPQTSDDPLMVNILGSADASFSKPEQRYPMPRYLSSTRHNPYDSEDYDSSLSEDAEDAKTIDGPSIFEDYNEDDLFTCAAYANDNNEQDVADDMSTPWAKFLVDDATNVGCDVNRSGAASSPPSRIGERIQEQNNGQTGSDENRNNSVANACATDEKHAHSPARPSAGLKECTSITSGRSTNEKQMRRKAHHVRDREFNGRDVSDDNTIQPVSHSPTDSRPAGPIEPTADIPPTDSRPAGPIEPTADIPPQSAAASTESLTSRANAPSSQTCCDTNGPRGSVVNTNAKKGIPRDTSVNSAASVNVNKSVTPKGRESYNKGVGFGPSVTPNAAGERHTRSSLGKQSHVPVASADKEPSHSTLSTIQNSVDDRPKQLKPGSPKSQETSRHAGRENTGNCNKSSADVFSTSEFVCDGGVDVSKLRCKVGKQELRRRRLTDTLTERRDGQNGGVSKATLKSWASKSNLPMAASTYLYRPNTTIPADVPSAAHDTRHKADLTCGNGLPTAPQYKIVTSNKQPGGVSVQPPDTSPAQIHQSDTSHTKLVTDGGHKSGGLEAGVLTQSRKMPKSGIYKAPPPSVHRNKTETTPKYVKTARYSSSDPSLDQDHSSASESDYDENDEEISLSSYESDMDSPEQSHTDTTQLTPSKNGRVIPTDHLLTRREFRRAGRSVLYSLLQACRQITRSLSDVRTSIIARSREITLEILKLKLILG